MYKENTKSKAYLQKTKMPTSYLSYRKNKLKDIKYFIKVLEESTQRLISQTMKVFHSA